MRTIRELTDRKEQVNVYLASESVCGMFLRQAEEEGFTVGKNMRPTEAAYNDLFALHKDLTISHHGLMGHLAFHAKETRTAVSAVWIDYAKYAAGGPYVIKRTGPGLGYRIGKARKKA